MNFVFLEMTSNSTYFENSRHYYFEIPFFSSYCSLGIHNCQCDRDVCTLNDVLKLDFLVSPSWCHFASHYLSKIFLCGIFMCVQIYRTFLNKGAINILMTRDSIFNILSILYMWLPSILGSRVDPSGSQNVSLTLTMTNGSKDTLGNKNSVPKVNGSSLAATLS